MELRVTASERTTSWQVDPTDVANAVLGGKLVVDPLEPVHVVARMFWALPLTMWQAALDAPPTDKRLG
ncbi:hypothetical protein HFO33_29490 [Rhizobium leguminosarum]|uniref:hypothetical protein n=1 Tax=Rhizobium leguminosarum TaxID=384 RepID=UPI001C94CED5|nr:hypothetical protein [Rhizobium leguminosarum]MBY5720672.1 hypothetical protein [Rhizobium leguminosarum]